jgi:DMSO/TMAO reductase YedYZ molybdopterin-dependent catalytic subunit
MKRRIFVASSLAALGLTDCGPAKQQLTNASRGWLSSVENVNHALIGTHGMAKLYTDADVDRVFRTNGFETPADARYVEAYHNGDFRTYRLPINGLVDRPYVFTLAELRAMPLLTQITRHDCVEGWSAVGKWRGVPLATVLAMAAPQANARYVVFRCFDTDQSGEEYYESLDLTEAAHPQTLLALDLNDAPLDPAHGAPVRLRVPTQLGYKSAKWVRGIEIAAALPGAGGYWEEQGYEWYAGI